MASATWWPRAMEESSMRASASDVTPAPRPSDDPEVLLQGAAPLTREVADGGQPFPRRRGDGERGVALAAQAQAGQVGGVLHEDRGVDGAGHRVQVGDVARVHHRRVAETVLDPL